MTGFRQRRVVRADEADALGHANNVVYLRWVLEAAEAHWARLRERAAPEAVAGTAWVVLRHELDYLAPAFPGDALQVTTWVPSCTSTTSERLAVVARAADGAVLARARSVYAVVDLATGRPRRLTEGLRQAIGGPPMTRRDREARAFPPPPAEVVE
jgi:acyl-CoA thioester hydrolase